jgi:hypothetical protein
MSGRRTGGAAYRRRRDGGGLTSGERTGPDGVPVKRPPARPCARNPASLEGDGREIERNEEVFEEVLDDADLVVQAVIAFE